MAYTYQADIYCDQCGREIMSMLDARGQEDTGDSDDYPQWASDDEETDCPQHCGSGEECLDYALLSDGTKIGCLVGTTLTSEGVEYVKNAVAESHRLGEVASVAIEVWEKEFSWIDFPNEEEDEDD